MILTKAIYLGEAGGNQPRRQVGDVEENPVVAGLLHLVYNATGYYIPGRHLSPGNIIGHEPAAFHVS